jgi:hypothetical protein
VEIVLQLAAKPQNVSMIFLQLTFVADMPVSFEVLQPARTFSSGVPRPRTINWGGIHFVLLPSIFILLGEMPPRRRCATMCEMVLGLN